MHHFKHKDHVLYAEDVSVEKLAQEFGTPFYVYSTATIKRHYHVLDKAMQDEGLDARICFAAKANSNLGVLKVMADLGSGADIVSQGEMRLALQAGIAAQKMVFSGVGKTRGELEFALSHGIGQINVESLPELYVLAKVAQNLNTPVDIAFRVNPDVDAKTHEKISTGRLDNKFGIPFATALKAYQMAQELPYINPVSVAMHIGSQLTDLAPYAQAFARLRGLAENLLSQGIGLKRLDIGGGLGIPYDHVNPPLPRDYAKVVADTLGPLKLPLILEPGRLLVGNAGLLVSRIIYVKQGASHPFLITDAGMNDLIRPSLYGSYHDIIPIKMPVEEGRLQVYDVVGPVCETGDTFAKKRKLPIMHSEDLIAFASCGAYGAVMSGTYNARLLVPEILVEKEAYSLVRPRQTYDELLAQTHFAPWQKF